MKTLGEIPALNTKRLYLRKLQVGDLLGLVELCNNEAISKQTYNLPFPYTLEFAKNRLLFIEDGFQQRSRIVWLITELQSGGILGEMGLHFQNSETTAELGYWIGEPFWNKGIATEALMAVLEFGFQQLGLHKIYATHFGDNPASGKVMVKCGMNYEGRLREHVFARGSYKDLVQYGLLKSEWERAIGRI